MIYLTLGNLIVRSPEQGHPQRVHVHLWGVKKNKKFIIQQNYYLIQSQSFKTKVQTF